MNRRLYAQAPHDHRRRRSARRSTRAHRLQQRRRPGPSDPLIDQPARGPRKQCQQFCQRRDGASDGRRPRPRGHREGCVAKYPAGTEVTLTAEHMEGMDGANATIAGAFDTYTYAVNFTPTTGGNPVKDHKWVVQEEIKDAGDQRLADGTEVTLEAEHMEGMKGAKATIASSTDQTVYMVDYESDGMTMTNHKWVVESEIKPAS